MNLREQGARRIVANSPAKVLAAPEFMNQKADAFVGFVRVARQCPCVTLGGELHHSVRNGVIEASIQRPKIIDSEGGVAFERQVRDGLAEISTVVNDLVDRVFQSKEICVMRSSTGAYLVECQAVAA